MLDLIRMVTGDLVAFLEQQLPRLSDDWWTGNVLERLTPSQWRMVQERGNSTLRQLDFAALLRVLDQNWFDLSRDLRLPREARSWVKELQSVRNRWAHQTADGVSVADRYRDADTLGRLLTVLGAKPDSLAAIEKVRAGAFRAMSPGLQPPVEQRLRRPEAKEPLPAAALIPSTVPVYDSDPIVIIQCAGAKQGAGYLRTRDGRPVMIVPHPELAPKNDGYFYARPDDPCDQGGTWRQQLEAYNENPGNNPLGLLPAYRLYRNRAYGDLVERFGMESTYILSAGWGLLRGAFLTPIYDMTFSPQGMPHIRRGRKDEFSDFCQLPRGTDRPVVFFGGAAYMPQFLSLTRWVRGPRVVFFNRDTPPLAPGCRLIRYQTSIKTNWHYACAAEFAAGRIGIAPDLKQAPVKAVVSSSPSNPPSPSPLAKSPDAVPHVICRQPRGNGRLSDLKDFYGLLEMLAGRSGGPRRLAECSGRQAWPQRGVYFFMEEGEGRSDSGRGLRVVRIGTHALMAGSRTTLWTRLMQHRGQNSTGGGNHRSSIFRLLVGNALACRDGYDVPTWGKGSSAPADVVAREVSLEEAVTKVVGSMPLLWLAVEDSPSPNSLRGVIERNTIALLSNFSRNTLDPPSAGWLGHSCDRPSVKQSGLWNQRHVEETYDPKFLTVLEKLIAGR